MNLSAEETVAQLRRGDINSEQILQKQLSKISEFNPDLNAFVHVVESKESHNPSGLLHGLPVSIKDQIHVAGMPCTSGFEGLADFVPENDAKIVTDLKAAGAQILGKTNLPPLAMDFQTYNKVHGRTNNPWDQSYTTGGSSGGGACAVASGMSFAEIGTDLAGSLRIPASYCGVCSLMPTVDTLSTRGTMTLVEQSNHTIEYLPRVGPITRNIGDLRLMWEALSGSDRCLQAKDRVNKSIRLAVLPPSSEFPLHSQIEASIKHCSDVLSSTDGIQLTPAVPEGFDWHQAWQAYGVIQGYQFSALANPVQRLLGRLMSRAAVRRSPTFIKPIQQGNRRKKIWYQQAIQTRSQIIGQLDEFFKHYDAWILPVTLVPAFQHVQASFETDFVRDYDHSFDVMGQKLNYFEALTRLTTPFNLTGHPVVTLPVIKDNNTGIPIGVQIVGKRNGETALLAVAEEIERCLGLNLYPLSSGEFSQ